MEFSMDLVKDPRTARGGVSSVEERSGWRGRWGEFFVPLLGLHSLASLDPVS